MGPEDDARDFAEHFVRVAAHIDQGAGVPFLWHRGGSVSGGDKDPGTRLRVLRHHVLNELRHVKERLDELQLRFNRDVRPRDLPRVVRVINDPFKPEKLCHPVTVERPGGAVKHGGPHGGEIETRPEFLQVLDIAAEPLKVPEPGVAEAVRLRRDPVCVAGGDGVPVLIGKCEERGSRGVQIPDNPHDLIADHRALKRGMHVLGRAPGVNEGHLDPSLLDITRSCALHQVPTDFRSRSPAAVFVTKVALLISESQ